MSFAAAIRGPQALARNENQGDPAIAFTKALAAKSKEVMAKANTFNDLAVNVMNAAEKLPGATDDDKLDGKELTAFLKLTDSKEADAFIDKYNTNNDDSLDQSELATGLEKEIGVEEDGGSSGGGGGGGGAEAAGGGGGGGSGSSAGGSGAGEVSGFLRLLLRILGGEDGKLSEEEFKKYAGSDGKLSEEELVAALKDAKVSQADIDAILKDLKAKSGADGQDLADGLKFDQLTGLLDASADQSDA